jgi:sec-independent protein translocase protein TatB
MFGFDIEKLAVIGAVALIFIGPERLPRVARTLGTLIGRAQRYLADVRAEVTREIQLDELREVRDSVRNAAHSVGETIRGGLEQTRSDIVSAIGTPKAESRTETSAAPTGTHTPAPQPLDPVKRERWRRNIAARQSSTPLWYRQSRRRRTRVLSAAARVARFRVRSSAR